MRTSKHKVFKCRFHVFEDLFLLPFRQYRYICKKQQSCKYFSQAILLHNPLFIKALQNLLFCVPKAAVLHGKSVGFASQKSRFRNVKAQLSLFKRIIFTKLELFFSNCYRQEKDSSFPPKTLSAPIFQRTKALRRLLNETL
ncbi:hypothetical protein CLI71_04600 [Prevotella intermedia]|uniref:Uncharacterized protein n=1 Tax=Prevotella intermedia TaxID=28131 RepID=A0A2A6EG27_PREIN|nr:hypothetical protein CLI71_04600 [Prevotella intermedia]